MLDRRLLLGFISAAAVAPSLSAQGAASPVLKRVRTSTLEIAYEESGPETGVPILLLHGFPYDPRCYDEVAPPLAAAGHRVIVPYLRGYGPTRFLSDATPRSGQQAALGKDMLDLLDALDIPKAALVGFDWGGRGACIAAALWPQRVHCLVSANGYNIQDIAGSPRPAPPEQEHRLWYQYYFHTERGRAGLTTNRRDLCKLLWQLWSPNWKFDDAAFARSAPSSTIRISSRSSFSRTGTGMATLPATRHWRASSSNSPRVHPSTVPTIVLQGEGDGVGVATRTDTQARFFTGRYERRLIPLIGHDVPQEASRETVAAVLDLLRGAL